MTGLFDAATVRRLFGEVSVEHRIRLLESLEPAHFAELVTDLAGGWWELPPDAMDPALHVLVELDPDRAERAIAAALEVPAVRTDYDALYAMGHALLDLAPARGAVHVDEVVRHAERAGLPAAEAHAAAFAVLHGRADAAGRVTSVLRSPDERVTTALYQALSTDGLHARVDVTTNEGRPIRSAHTRAAFHPDAPITLVDELLSGAAPLTVERVAPLLARPAPYARGAARLLAHVSDLSGVAPSVQGLRLLVTAYLDGCRETARPVDRLDLATTIERLGVDLPENPERAALVERLRAFPIHEVVAAFEARFADARSSWAGQHLAWAAGHLGRAELVPWLLAMGERANWEWNGEEAADALARIGAAAVEPMTRLLAAGETGEGFKGWLAEALSYIDDPRAREAVEHSAWDNICGHRFEPAPIPVRSEQVGRNDPCPCGSGKKYKKCCLTAMP